MVGQQDNKMEDSLCT